MRSMPMPDTDKMDDASPDAIKSAADDVMRVEGHKQNKKLWTGVQKHLKATHKALGNMQGIRGKAKAALDKMKAMPKPAAAGGPTAQDPDADSDIDATV